MKIQLLILSAATGLLFTSCEQLGGNASNPYGAPTSSPNASPYGNPANPYATPQANGETNAYSSNNPNYLPNSGPNAAAPYQPLPGVANTPSVAPVDSGYAPAAAPTNAGTLTPHTVAAGDSLWGLARKYNTSVQAIQQANGMTNTVIRVGETIQIPSN